MILPEVIREAFHYQRTHPAQPKLLSGKSQFWLEDVDELDDVADVPFTEDEDGKMLLECLLQNHNDLADNVYEHINLLIQCMYSLFRGDSEISETSPRVCLEQMVRENWVDEESFGRLRTGKRRRTN